MSTDLRELANNWWARRYETQVRVVAGAAAALLVLVFMIPACTTSTEEAIEQVLRADAALSELSEAMAQEHGERAATRWYCEQMQRIDLSNCPSDFRQAFVQHIHAWRRMSQHLQNMPQNAMEGAISGFINGLYGERDGGVRRNFIYMNALSNDIRETYFAVQNVATKHGARLPDP